MDVDSASSIPPIPEVTLHRDEVEAIVTASGAAVRSLLVDGRPLLRSFPPSVRPPGAANIVLAPWPNRVEDATFTFEGVKHQLEVTEPELGHALHGFTWGRIFEIEPHATTSTSVELRTVLGPEPGWPWQIALTVRYQLLDAGAGIAGTMTAENIGDEKAPCALGVHTYLDALGAPLDECTLHHGIEKRQPLDERNIPVGQLEDWPANPIVMDGVWLDDSGCAPGDRPHVATLLGGNGEGVELEASSSMRWSQIFTSPQRYLAVEPMTTPPNALATGEDLTTLEPGERMSVSWTVRAIN